MGKYDHADIVLFGLQHNVYLAANLERVRIRYFRFVNNTFRLIADVYQDLLFPYLHNLALEHFAFFYLGDTLIVHSCQFLFETLAFFFRHHTTINSLLSAALDFTVPPH